MGVCVQNAKDSFYEVLRGRLATLNPERSVVVRGVTRPGLVVDENETESVAPLPDCFHLRWTGTTVADQGVLPFVTMTCEIAYGTAGSSLNGGLDRGRTLAAMDGELLTAVRTAPQNALKSDYSGLARGAAATAMSTRLWWSEVAFAGAKTEADRVTRVATVQVMSFQEAGEL